MRKRRTRRPVIAITIAILVLIAVGAVGLKLYYAGPLAFADASTVALPDYRAANPTGVPAELASADVAKRQNFMW